MFHTLGLGLGITLDACRMPEDGGFAIQLLQLASRNIEMQNDRQPLSHLFNALAIFFILNNTGNMQLPSGEPGFDQLSEHPDHVQLALRTFPVDKSTYRENPWFFVQGTHRENRWMQNFGFPAPASFNPIRGIRGVRYYRTENAKPPSLAQTKCLLQGKLTDKYAVARMLQPRDLSGLSYDHVVFGIRQNLFNLAEQREARWPSDPVGLYA